MPILEEIINYLTRQRAAIDVALSELQDAVDKDRQLAELKAQLQTEQDKPAFTDPERLRLELLYLTGQRESATTSEEVRESSNRGHWIYDKQGNARRID